VGRCPERCRGDLVSIWAELDLVIRRYAIGEAVAFDHYGRAQRLMRQYVDAVAVSR